VSLRQASIQDSGEFFDSSGAGIIDPVRQRWLSKRAFSLHIGVLLFAPGCAAAAWWQITRATDGNGLSYLYAIEWPIFAILGVYFWWMLIHTDYDTVGLKGMRNRAAAEPGATSESPAPIPDINEDPELAAYNARLAALATKGPKTWRSPESVVVRRSR
jgi:DNA-binding transcriptional regulator of glucitol operon